MRKTSKRQYWLLKTEPDTFSIHDLARRPDQTEPWDGVRNYQARNYIRDQVCRGDQVFIYHSSCKSPGIAGTAVITRSGYPDASAWNARDNNFDTCSSNENPRWYSMDVKLLKIFNRTITLKELHTHALLFLDLASCPLLRKGSRLSVMPISPAVWEYINALE